jgi:4-aminobutyrate aminotransferase/(S)-3-amino-2-methylpropionate transaminase
MNSSSQTSNKELLARLASVECQDATFHSMPDPLVIESARGSILWDAEGRDYIDMCAGFGALPLGHNDASLISALSSRLLEAPGRLIHGLGDVCPTTEKIAVIETLLASLPERYSRATLCVTGSQAVEVAMKTAILATGGTGFISFSAAYHGLDFGALTVTGLPFFKEPFAAWGTVPQVSHLPFGADASTIRRALDDQTVKGIRPAAVIVEPVLGRGGFIPAPNGWLLDLERICKEKGILLIFDEIFSGLGRAGKWTFATEVGADLLCLGKALGGGMPLSACVGTEAAMSAWPKSQGEALHTGTFFGHPLSCFFGKATIDRLVQNDLTKSAADSGGRFLAHLHDAIGKSDKVLNIRGLGLMLAVEFRSPGDGARMMDLLREVAVIAIPAGQKGECISFTPALNVPDDLVDQTVSRIASVLPRL